MKAVSTVDLQAPQPQPKAKTSKTKPAAKTTGEGENMVRKTYSIGVRHDEQINAAAAVLTQRTGKPVGASEALRYILDNIDGKTKL